MPQIRSDSNPDLGDIRESIRVHGLLNPIDIAIVTEERLIEYVTFTNQLWGMKTDICDFADNAIDGVYHLVIAGHTRVEAISQLQNEDESKEYQITCKIHDIADPSEIIALQLDENLHTKPAQERRAMAVVEAYVYGKVNGRWLNETDFLAQNKGKFSKRILQDAMGFARLPYEVRDFVLGGHLSYNAAIEIGRATTPLIENIQANFGIQEHDEITDDIAKLMADVMHKKLDVWISHIQALGLNSTAAKTYILGQVGQLNEQRASLLNPESGETLFEMVSLDEQRSAFVAKVRKELWTAHQLLESVVDHNASRVIGLHRILSGVDMDQASQTIERSRNRLRAELGGDALTLVS